MRFDGSVTVKVCRGGPCGRVWYSVGVGNFFEYVLYGG